MTIMALLVVTTAMELVDTFNLVMTTKQPKKRGSSLKPMHAFIQEEYLHFTDHSLIIKKHIPL